MRRHGFWTCWRFRDKEGDTIKLPRRFLSTRPILAICFGFAIVTQQLLNIAQPVTRFLQSNS